MIGLTKQKLDELALMYAASLTDDTAPVPRLDNPSEEEKRVVLNYIQTTVLSAGGDFAPVYDSYCQTHFIVPKYLLDANKEAANA